MNTRSMRTFLPTLLAVVAPLAPAAHALQAQPLTASDGASSDEFGYSVAVSGDTAVVGAPKDDDHGSESGSAYVFARVGTAWVETQKLTAADGTSFDHFGHSVCLSGDRIAVGAPHDSEFAYHNGSVYVFAYDGSTWSQEAKLTVADASQDQEVGECVRMDGATLVTGARGDDHASWNSGAAYVFGRSGGAWSEEQKLTASDAFGQDFFGESVSVDGGTILVGAIGDDDNGSWSGSTYVFELAGGTWTERQKLLAGDGAAGDWFGASCAVDGTALVVGANGDQEAGLRTGAAYVFRHDGTKWSEEHKLTASDAAEEDSFGYSVAISGRTVVAGAYNDWLGSGLAGGFAGSAYLFAGGPGGWSELAKITHGTPTSYDEFGWGVALGGEALLVGVPLDDGPASTNDGSVHAFSLPLAAVASRNAGSNPASYTATLPVLGSTWSASVATGLTGHSHARVRGSASPASITLAGGQVLLVGGAPLFKLPLAAGPVATWTVQIPADLSLAGYSVHTQAVHLFGAAPFRLSNAQDLTLGF